MYNDGSATVLVKNGKLMLNTVRMEWIACGIISVPKAKSIKVIKFTNFN